MSSQSRGNIIRTAEDAGREFLKWYAIGKSLARRRFLSDHDAEDLLQDLAVHFLRYVHKGNVVHNPGAFLTTAFVRSMSNFFRRSKHSPLPDGEVIDPSSSEAQRREDREHAAWVVGRILATATPEERRSAEAYLTTGDNELAVDYLLAKEGATSPDRPRRRKSYLVAKTRLYARARKHFRPDPAA